MCSCSRDGKPHTDACRAAHRRYDRAAKGVVKKIRRRTRQFTKDTGVKI